MSRRIQRVAWGSTKIDFVENMREIVVERNCTDALCELFDTFDKDGDGILNGDESFDCNQNFVEPIKRLKCSLVVVDFQNDFISGTLPVKNGDAAEDPTDALLPINRLLLECSFDLVVYTMDWHPPNHISFFESHNESDRRLAMEDRLRELKPFDVVYFKDLKMHQKLYPAHCIMNTWGAELHSRLVRVKNSILVKKGIRTHVDSYSAFADNKKRSSGLGMVLRSRQIDAVFVCGLAYDVCVAATAFHAVDRGFFTLLITDCSKGIDKGAMCLVDKELKQRNIPLLTSTTVKEIVTGQLIPLQWMLKLGQRAEL